MKKFALFLLTMCFSVFVFAGHKYETTEGYIQKWKKTAIQQMELYRIPASITLAQGILESQHGNSILAIRANNHFGIKCHDWDGATFAKDDDRPNECFRKYENAKDSYIDHSLFLTSRARYNDLFLLKITDYKGWARGLKKAGYATDPKYASRLIEIIERYDLYKYDKTDQQNKNLLAKNEHNTQTSSAKAVVSKHIVFTNDNRTKYIIAGTGDTFYTIAQEFGLNLSQLERWNDFPPQKDILTKGDKVYIMRKRKVISEQVKKAAKNSNQLWLVAQKYGVQLAALIKENTDKSKINLANK